MDASTLAAAALAIATETSQPAVVDELLLERERLAMDREALRSFVVERHYIQAPDFSEDPIWTWRRAFDLQTAGLQEIRDHVRDVAELAQGTRILQGAMNDLDRELNDALELSAELAELPPGHAGAAQDERGTIRERSRSRHR